MREWLVIESARARAVFADGEERVKGYIPRDVAEPLLGRKIAGAGEVEWFTDVDSEKMRAHPEWRTTEPPHRTYAQRVRAWLKAHL